MKGLSIILAIVTVTSLASAQTPAAPSAEDLYAQGQTAYDHADWTTAIDKWKASFQLSGENGLWFNIAQAQRQSGDCQGALASYRRYVATDTDTTSDQHKIASDWVRDLETTCRSPDPQPTLDPKLNLAEDLNASKKAEHPGRTLKISGVAIGGVGIALVTTGLLYGLHAQTIAGEVTDACRSSNPVPCNWADWKDKDAAGRHDATIGRVLDGIGVATIVGGSVLYYFGVRQGSVRIEPHAREGGAVLSWSQAW